MRIAYIANIRFPTEKAHGYQIARVCSALQEIGCDVTLHVPTRRNHISIPWQQYYALHAPFPTQFHRCPDFMCGIGFFDRISFILQGLLFACLVLVRIDRTTIVMTRDIPVAALGIVCGRQVIFVAHKAHRGYVARFVYRFAYGIIANSRGTETALSTTTPTSVIPNAADPNPYLGADVRESRSALDLPQGCIVLYSGHLYRWKGIDTILETASLLRNDDRITFVLVGGTAADIEAYRARAADLPRVHFLGHQLREHVPRYTAAADILLVPNSAEGESVSETSPLKLFEYLGSGVPVIASDLPAIREVVSDQEVIFVPPDDGAALARAITSVVNDPSYGHAFAQRALQRSNECTWEKHARSIVAFIERILEDERTKERV